MRTSYKKCKFEVSASRVTSNREAEFIQLRIQETGSRSGLDVKLTLAQFAEIITSKVVVDVPGELWGSEHFGKIKVRETRTWKVPLEVPYKFKSQQYWEEFIKKNYKESGWAVDPSLSGRGALTYSGQEAVLVFSVVRWLTPEEIATEALGGTVEESKR